MDAKVTKSSGEEETVTNVGSASFSPSGELLLWINSSTPPLRFEPPWMLRPTIRLWLKWEQHDNGNSDNE